MNNTDELIVVFFWCEPMIPVEKLEKCKEILGAKKVQIHRTL